MVYGSFSTMATSHGELKYERAVEHNPQPILEKLVMKNIFRGEIARWTLCDFYKQNGQPMWQVGQTRRSEKHITFQDCESSTI